MKTSLPFALALAILLVVVGRPAEAEPAGPVNEVVALDRVVTVKDLPPAAALPSAPSSQAGPPHISMPQFQAGGTVPQATSIDYAGSPGASIQTTLPSPPVLVSEFAALDNGDNIGTVAGAVNVPDPQLAAGPLHLMEMVNVVGRVYDKRTLVGHDRFALAGLFAVPSPRCSEGASPPCWSESDPRVLYDALSGRWIATYFSYINYPGTQTDAARLHIAVSQTSDPAGAWYVYYHPYSDNFPDQPWVGVTNDKITVAANLYDIDNPGGHVGVQTRVYNKAQALSGGPVTVTVFPVKPPASYFSIRPAQHMDPVNDQIAAMIGGNTLTVFRYSGVPGGTGGEVTETEVDIAVSGHSAPSSWAENPGGLIDPGDGRLDDAFVDDGQLWVTTATDCYFPPIWTFVCAQFIQVDVASGTESQNMVLGAPNWYFYYPAARTDAAGNLIVTMNRSASDIRVEVRMAGRRPSDTVNLVSYSTTFHAGETNISQADGARWGDYFAAARDPSGLGMCVWLVGEYAKDISGATGQQDWGTSIASATYSPYGGTCEDYDADGFTDAAEANVVTNPLDNCGNPTGSSPVYSQSWPADLRADGLSTNKIDLQDLATSIAPVRRLNTSPGDAGFNIRWDVNPGAGGLGKVINIADLSYIVTVQPLMFGGSTRAFNGPACTP